MMTTRQRKTISPYDITTFDNPGLLITQVQLKGENYDKWACSVRTLWGRERNLAQLILKIGRLLISYWCPGFETPLNHLSAQWSHMSRSHRTYGIIFTTGFHWSMDQEFSKSNQILLSADKKEWAFSITMESLNSCGMH